MIIKIRGKRYRWRFQDMDGRLLVFICGLGVVANCYAWFVLVRAALVLWG